MVLVAVQLFVLGLYLPPVFKCAESHSAPDDHFAAGPDCRVRASAIGRVGGAGGCPTVCAGIVSPTSVQSVLMIMSAPDDHFTAGPDCRVTVSARGRVGRAGGCPTIRAGIVSPASVQIVKLPSEKSAPDDHFTAGPDCRVIVRAVGALVVLVAVQLSVLGLYLPPVLRGRLIISAPDDHFTAGPDCRVTSRAEGALVVLVAVQYYHARRITRRRQFWEECR